MKAVIILVVFWAYICMTWVVCSILAAGTRRLKQEYPLTCRSEPI